MGGIGPYFRNKRGVRQGDPISPCCLIFWPRRGTHASAAGHIKGVVSHLVPKGVTHLQYADDTILLIELDDGVIANLKFILICFEILSGLKINFFKSEVIVTGVSPHEQSRVARMFNCKEGGFLITYLGFPIADMKLSIADINYLVETVGHRVDPWQGRYSSTAARIILTNSSLASLPSHCMGLFLLAEGTHAGFDKHLARFF
jgi:hypothetical protein